MEEEKAAVFCFPATQVPYSSDHIKLKEKGRLSLESSKVGVNKAKRRHYLCKYCNKKFSSFQALGGHQNGHKYEKALARQRKRSTLVTMGMPTRTSLLEDNIIANRRRSCLYPAMALADGPTGSAGSKAKGKGKGKGWLTNPQTAMPLPVSQLRMGDDHIIHRAGNGRFQLLVAESEPASFIYNSASGSTITSIPIPNSYINYYVPPPRDETKNGSGHMPGNLDLDLSLKL